MAQHYWIGLGANLGDPAAQLRAAISMLGQHGQIVRVSSVYETTPIGGPPQNNYSNAALLLQSELAPLGFLRACQNIEATLGRQREVVWGPRTIDLDILLVGEHGEIVIAETSLQVPHPRLHERAFALQPLVDLDATLAHPLSGKALVDLLAQAKQSGQMLIARGVLR